MNGQTPQDQGPGPEVEPLQAALARAEDEIEEDEGSAAESQVEQTGKWEPLEAEAEPQPEPEAEEDKEEESAEEQEDVEEEPEEEAEPEETLATIELPAPLKEQGFEDFDVPKEQEPLFRALVKDYEGRRVREEREARIEAEEAARHKELEEFRMLVETEPFEVISATLGNDASEESFRFWLMQSPERWERHITWMEELRDDADVSRAKRELELGHRERTINAQDRMRTREIGRRVAAQVQEKLQEVMDAVNPEDRPFVQERLVDEIRSYAAQQRQRTGSDIIDPRVVESLAEPWVLRFPNPTPSTTARPPKPAQAGEGDRQKKLEEGRNKIRAKARARKVARKTVTTSGAPTAKPSRPPKGMPLDAVLEKAKRGELQF